MHSDLHLITVCNPELLGIDEHEIFDTRQLAKQIDSWYSNNGQGNPDYANMPRKFNIAISGTRDDFSHTNINDIGLQACLHETTGEVGFNVVLGGYISIKRAAEAIPMNAWIPATDAFDLCKSILRIFRDEGARGDRQKTRLMWLIESKGLDVFNEMVSTEMASIRGVSSYAFQPAQKQKGEWTLGHRDVNGVHPQKQAGLSYVGVHVPVGRLSADECLEIADLAEKYSSSEIRLTVEQNLLFPNIPNERIPEFLLEPIFTKEGSRLSVNPGHIVGHVVSCTGSQFCPLAMVETKLAIDVLTRKLEAMVHVPKPIRIHMTGCPNSCGQVQVADIGLMGAPARKADAEGTMKAVPGVNIFIGGKVGEQASLMMEPTMKGIPMSDEDLLPVLAKIIVEKYQGVMKV
jgi:ferredoxin-nitrite reductase